VTAETEMSQVWKFNLRTAPRAPTDNFDSSLLYLTSIEFCQWKSE